MKHFSIFSVVIVVLLSFNFLQLHAQHHWAMATMEEGMAMPTIIEYHSVIETSDDRVEYYRIYDDGYRFRKEAYNPIKTPYGYRWNDKKMYIYDYVNQKETLAFDLNLSKGDHFTTFNGMEWIVEAVKDTLVNISFCGNGECVSKRLLTVCSTNGNTSDQWLEDFGSFSNHFMILNMEDVKWSQTLWMEYNMGEYLSCEIKEDPYYSHDSGWMDSNSEENANDKYTKCVFENGQLSFENAQWCYEHRSYSFFYRIGDDIYQIYSWELEPHVDSGTLAIRKDVVIFDRLPVPESGIYTVHIDDNCYTTNISNLINKNKSTDSYYNINGQCMCVKPEKGVYIQSGKKYVVK